LKLISLDFGAVRIGVAIGNSKIGVATPRPFLVNDSKLLTTLAKICKIEKIDKIILGLPQGLNGETAQTQIVKEFSEKLQKDLNIEIDFIDERFTSKIAEKKLREDKKSARAQKNLIDSESARIILQDFFDRPS